jgi:putative membrane protein
VAIAAAWAVVGAYGASVAAMLVPKRARPVVAAVWMTLLDGVIDPVASTALGFWRWPGGGSYYGVPLTNFAGWLAVGLIISLTFQRQEPCRAALRVGFATLVFFTVISLAHGLAGAGLVGIALCSAHLAMALGLQRSAQ